MSNFTFVGSPTAISIPGGAFSGSGTVTLSTIGNLLIVGTACSAGDPQTLSCTGVSGGFTALENTASLGDNVILWMGVITATGSQTLSGANTSSYFYFGMIAQEVACAGTPTVDTTANTSFAAGPTSGNFPSITPTFPDDAVFCVGMMRAGTMSTTTSGYTYSPTATSAFSGTMYMTMNPDVPAGTPQSPDWNGTSASAGGTLLSVALKAGRMRMAMSP